jgi:uncharacterized protein
MKNVNPFPTVEYISPDLFCDRESELKQMVEVIDNQRNLVLISRRRMGKTALIQHCFQHLKGRKELSFHYFDIYATRDLKDFVNMLATSLIGYFESKPEVIFNRLIKLLGQFRPVFSLDHLTGSPSISLSLQTETEAQQGLDKIFQYLEVQKQRVVLAIDEFQQITSYPEKNVEALLRTHIQKCKNVSLIFSGSNRHMLISIFNDYARPFYQSAGFLFLGKIEWNTYKQFIRAHFSKAGSSISDDALELIYIWTTGHTYFVQEMCNRLYSAKFRKIDQEEVRQVLIRILDERAPLNQTYQNILTRLQFALLKAIALEESVEKPTSSEFLKKHKLGAASSVKRTLTTLEQQDLIYHEESRYAVSDIFLMHWLRRFQ